MSDRSQPASRNRQEGGATGWTYLVDLQGYLTVPNALSTETVERLNAVIDHAPNVAIAIVLIVGAAFCYLTSFVNLSNIVALQSLFFALILLAGGVAALYPQFA